MSRGRSRRDKREKLRAEAQERAAQIHKDEQDNANKREKRDAWKPPSSLTPKRLRFAILWAEADPEDSLQDVMRRAGFSESCSANGYVAELCRDPAVIEVRDHRLRELQQASRVTVEDALVGLRALAFDTSVSSRDRVAAFKTILAWYARDKGQHAPGAKTTTAAGMGDQLAQALAQHLGIPIESKEGE